jgi:hypothetical protein
VDFVLTYPQAGIECTLCMEIPRGFKFKGSKSTHCLELKKNLYGQKYAVRVWNGYLHDGLLTRGFVQSRVNMCIYYRGKIALILYTDDGVFLGPIYQDIHEAYNCLTKPIGEHRAFKMSQSGKTTERDNQAVTAAFDPADPP